MLNIGMLTNYQLTIQTLIDGDDDADEIKHMFEFRISAQTDDDIKALPHMVDSGHSIVIRP